MPETSPGILYIVATPIGNLEDMTFRAIRILKEVDLIAAEDTRHSRKLLNHFGLATRMTPYHDHNEQLKTDYLLEKLLAGENIALITDAGTPCIADPGYRIAKAAVDNGIKTVPIPGASAIVTALSASGLPSDRFAFEGFLPAKEVKRKAKLEELKNDSRVIIFYEAPHRLTATLSNMAEILDDREVVVARELTKIHEELRHGTPAELLKHYSQQTVKGEIVIAISPYNEQHSQIEYDPETNLRRYLFEKSLSVKDATSRVSAESGRSRSEIYAIALSIKATSPLSEE